MNPRENRVVTLDLEAIFQPAQKWLIVKSLWLHLLEIESKFSSIDRVSLALKPVSFPLFENGHSRALIIDQQKLQHLNLLIADVPLLDKVG